MLMLREDKRHHILTKRDFIRSVVQNSSSSCIPEDRGCLVCLQYGSMDFYQIRGDVLCSDIGSRKDPQFEKNEPNPNTCLRT